MFFLREADKFAFYYYYYYYYYSYRCVVRTNMTNTYSVLLFFCSRTSESNRQTTSRDEHTTFPQRRRRLGVNVDHAAHLLIRDNRSFPTDELRTERYRARGNARSAFVDARRLCYRYEKRNATQVKTTRKGRSTFRDRKCHDSLPRHAIPRRVQLIIFSNRNANRRRQTSALPRSSGVRQTIRRRDVAGRYDTTNRTYARVIRHHLPTQTTDTGRQ